eukprot:2037351-Pleurochrysis_carterae.AAC.1
MPTAAEGRHHAVAAESVEGSGRGDEVGGVLEAPGDNQLELRGKGRGERRRTRRRTHRGVAT